MEGKRLDFPDIAKGLGIIFVLFSHSCGFPVFGNAIVAFYMPMYFFISGYVYKPGRSVSENIRRRLKQLLIPYVGFTFLLYAEHIVLAALKHELTRETILMPLLGALYSRAVLYADMTGENVEFFTISNNPMWFITAMAVASIIFYFLVEQFIRNRRFMIVTTVVLTAITAAFTYCPVLMPWSIDTAFACALFMLAGAWLGNREYFSDENKKKFPVIYVCLAAAVYGCLCEIAKPINLSLRDYGYDGILGTAWFLAAAFTGIIIFLWICRYLERFSWTKVLILVGKHTFTIMCLHILMIKYLNKIYYMFHFGFDFTRQSLWYWLYWIVIHVVIIAACIGFDKVKGWIKNKWRKMEDYKWKRYQ